LASSNTLKIQKFRLVSSPNRNLPVVRQPLEEWISGNIDPGVPTSKKSLVNKLEIISKGTKLIFTGNSSAHFLLWKSGLSTREKI